jgi:hypothetical protein
MNTKPTPQPKNAPHLSKEHEAAYRALMDLLIRQVERETRDEAAALEQQIDWARAKEVQDV